MIRFKPKGTRFAFECDTALRVDQVNAIRPACIGVFGRIAKLIEHGGKLDPKFPNAGPGDERAIFFSFRAGKNNLVFDITLHLPDVAGMRLGDVDNQEGNGRGTARRACGPENLPPERRSRIATEYQDHGLPLTQRRELNSLTLIHFEQREVRRGIAGVKRSGASVEPCSLKRKNQEGHGARHPGHDPTESFGRLMIAHQT